MKWLAVAAKGGGCKLRTRTCVIFILSSLEKWNAAHVMKYAFSSLAHQSYNNHALLPADDDEAIIESNFTGDWLNCVCVA